MSPYTVRVGNRDESRFQYKRDAVEQMLAETREQATYRHPRSVTLYHYGEIIAAW